MPGASLALLFLTRAGIGIAQWLCVAVISWAILERDSNDIEDLANADTNSKT